MGRQTKKKRWAGAVGSSFEADVKLLSAADCLALVPTTGGRRDEDARASRFQPRACPAARAICTTIGRQPQSCSVFANAHSAPVHRLDMHRSERLRAAIAHVYAHTKARPLAFLQSFLPLLTTLFATQFRPIFHKLACSFLASKMLEPARESLFVKSMLTAIIGLRSAAALLRLDVSRPPLASGFVLEMFGPTGDSPLQQRTRNETRTHVRKVVQESDAYEIRSAACLEKSQKSVGGS
ncbi:hypothetical protein IVB30_05985 [Bradyrhizobium sp. 200]|uniref:hypothetical protein n=1 Tax=Bradyrhizobium sp. 200 TaxID=2782665 RepID=UPI001FFED2BA|nr:hypothetical protein [Bradyrhizobium sp. 200]UPJ50928.1 hypothetical protein IVB30_05985 [Bradyrhizobium sp. 200]